MLGFPGFIDWRSVVGTGRIPLDPQGLGEDCNNRKSLRERELRSLDSVGEELGNVRVLIQV